MIKILAKDNYYYTVPIELSNNNLIMLDHLPIFEEDDEICIQWNYSSPIEQPIIYDLVCHYRDMQIKQIHLILPYIPYSYDKYDYANTSCFSLRYFAKFINDLKFSSVMVLDPPEDIAAILFDNIVIIPPDYLLMTTIKETGADILCCVDSITFSKYKRLGLPLPIIYCTDTSEGEKQIIKSESLSLEKKKVLIITDMCSNAGVFTKISNLLFNHKVDSCICYATHCDTIIFKTLPIKDPTFCKFYTTDSLISTKEPSDNKIRVMKLNFSCNPS